MTYQEKRLQEFREKFEIFPALQSSIIKANLEAFLAETIDEMKGMIESDLLIKCECEDGGCPNCQRMCKLLDDIGLRDKFGKEEKK